MLLTLNLANLQDDESVIKKAKQGVKEIRKLDEFSITKDEEPIIFKITIEEVSPNVTKSDNESN